MSNALAKRVLLVVPGLVAGSILLGLAPVNPARAADLFQPQAPAAQPAPNISGIARGAQRPYRITRRSGTGNKFYIESVTPVSISLGAVAPKTIAVSATVSLRLNGVVFLHDPSVPLDALHAPSCGREGKSQTCTATYETANLRDGEPLRFAMTMAANVQGSVDLVESYLVEIPVHRAKTRMRVVPR
ncbi:MAG TPA: hypothetical protein VI319_15035 [Burkholderiales bacterium]